MMMDRGTEAAASSGLPAAAAEGRSMADANSSLSKKDKRRSMQLVVTRLVSSLPFSATPSSAAPSITVATSSVQSKRHSRSASLPSTKALVERGKRIISFDRRKGFFGCAGEMVMADSAASPTGIFMQHATTETTRRRSSSSATSIELSPDRPFASTPPRSSRVHKERYSTISCASEATTAPSLTHSRATSSISSVASFSSSNAHHRPTSTWSSPTSPSSDGLGLGDRRRKLDELAAIEALDAYMDKKPQDSPLSFSVADERSPSRTNNGQQQLTAMMRLSRVEEDGAARAFPGSSSSSSVFDDVDQRIDETRATMASWRTTEGANRVVAGSLDSPLSQYEDEEDEPSAVYSWRDPVDFSLDNSHYDAHPSPVFNPSFNTTCTDDEALSSCPRSSRWNTAASFADDRSESLRLKSSTHSKRTASSTHSTETIIALSSSSSISTTASGGRDGSGAGAAGEIDHSTLEELSLYFTGPMVESSTTRSVAVLEIAPLLIRKVSGLRPGKRSDATYAWI